MFEVDDSRLAMELQLLDAMYPGQIDFDPHSRDFKFTDQAALLHLRVPESYPQLGFPDVLSARNSSKTDLRNQTKAAIQQLGLSEGEEALDAIIASFHTLSSTNASNTSHTVADLRYPPTTSETNKTVIIWLHHLLALTKRKLALSPASSLSGITKPGYPGILIFSGPASAVAQHVNILKAENWQAFQVRYEEEEMWQFEHGQEVKEVETMAEVVKAIAVGELGTRRKEDFLKAVGIK